MKTSCPRPAANAEKGLLKFVEMCKQRGVQHILDIGAGDIEYHANDLRGEGFEVSSVDFFDHSTYRGEYLKLPAFDHQFDAIWCAHTFEHQRNPGQFLDRVCADTKDGGVICVTVPPAKMNIVGGHVTVWNAGLLLYQMILAGIDCSEASVASYGYNISVVVPKRSIELPPLIYDKGDIETLSAFFPKALGASQGFDGDIEELNW